MAPGTDQCNVNRSGLPDAAKRRIIVALPSRLGRIDVTTTPVAVDA